MKNNWIPASLLFLFFAPTAHAEQLKSIHLGVGKHARDISLQQDVVVVHDPNLTSESGPKAVGKVTAIESTETGQILGTSIRSVTVTVVTASGQTIKTSQVTVFPEKKGPLEVEGIFSSRTFAPGELVLHKGSKSLVKILKHYHDGYVLVQDMGAPATHLVSATSLEKADPNELLAQKAAPVQAISTVRSSKGYLIQDLPPVEPKAPAGVSRAHD